MEKLLNKKTVIQLVGVSAVTLYQWMKAGKFPRAVRLQENDKYGKCAWFESEISEWIENRKRVRYKGDPRVRLESETPTKKKKKVPAST